METHAKVVIIGGGIVGCSILFHLAKHGWKDVVLLERSELTSGSSWHAAGLVHTLSSDPNVSLMQNYTINLYKEIERISGQAVGLHTTGGLYLASTPERLDFLKQERSKARYLGLDQEFISLDEVARLNPLIDTRKYLGALYDPIDGHVDPSGATYAFAKAARHFGARYYRHVPVIETNQRADGSWDVVTRDDTINAEIIVNAAGLWAREVGHLAGIDLPVQPMEHHYLITDKIPELQGVGHELPSGIDYEGNFYFREEMGGLILGTYEPTSTPWMIDGTPQDFGHELLNPDLERISERLEIAFDRIPALASAGIKNVINGPFTFGPDGNPMIGPVPGMRNYWVAVGVMAGFCQAGGVGLCMAEWMINGEPSINVAAMDIARFGDYATREYGTIKSAENYERRFLLTYPNEELPAGRKQKTTALYDRLVARGAVMGVSFGLEHALWFAGDPAKAKETPSYRRSNAFEHVAEEVAAVRSNVGAIEIANFAKHEFNGPGAEEFLDSLLAGRLPKIGRLALTPMLTPKGTLCGDLTVARLDSETFFIFGSGVAQAMHQRWFEDHLPRTGVTYHNRSNNWHGIALSGPKSRELLSRITRENVSADGFKFQDIRRTTVGGVPVMLVRLSFSGELGYEIYCAPQYQLKLFEQIEEAGSDLGLRLYGARTLMSLRLEKSWGVWSLDYRSDFTAAESGLDCFVRFENHENFIGREAAVVERERGPEKRFATFVVETDDIDAHGNEAILHNAECVGYVTSGGYGHRVGKSIALGYVPSDLVSDDLAFEIELLGERKPATIVMNPLYDADGGRMRS